MKTKEELNAIKEEVEALNRKLAELTEDELALVAGGRHPAYQYEDVTLTCEYCGKPFTIKQPKGKTVIYRRMICPECKKQDRGRRRIR